MIVTQQERKVQLGALAREREAAEARVSHLKERLVEAKDASDKKAEGFYEGELSRAQRTLDKVRDQLQEIGGQARTRRAKAETR